jgi:hypothetical protein
MRTRHKAPRPHWYPSPKVGENKEEKATQLERLYVALHRELGFFEPTNHPIYLRAKAHPYEDLSEFFREVDTLVDQRGLMEAAKKRFAEAVASANAPKMAWCPDHQLRYSLMEGCPACKAVQATAWKRMRAHLDRHKAAAHELVVYPTRYGTNGGAAAESDEALRVRIFTMGGRPSVSPSGERTTRPFNRYERKQIETVTGAELDLWAQVAGIERNK